MRKIIQRTAVHAAGLAALQFAVGLAFAQPTQPGRAPVSEPEIRYQAGGSPLATEEMHQNIDPKAPPMTKAEFDKGRKIYFERCAGCHGVLRKGATGKPLTPDLTMAKGTEILKVFIKYGSPAGMPNWGTSGELTDAEVDLMARYVQQVPPIPPEFGMAEMKKTWKVIIPPDQRPKKKDEQLQHRQHLLDHPARYGRGGADRRRHQEDHQHRQDRLRGAYHARVGLRTLPLRDRARRQDQHDRPVDGETGQRRRDPRRPRSALGGYLQVQGLRRQTRDRRCLLAAAVHHHERRHAGAAQDHVHPRHDGGRPGVSTRSRAWPRSWPRTSSRSSWSA